MIFPQVEIMATIREARNNKVPMSEIRTSGPKNAAVHLMLAHGAGAPMTSPFLETITGLLTDRGLRVSRFEFAYMTRRRQDGKRRPPPKAELMIPEYVEHVAQLRKDLPRRQRLLIGGKSMGGRIASLCADQLFADDKIAGLVCLGYPFHPPGKPDKLRTAHLEHLRCRTLIVQGERDPFGNRAETETYTLSSAIKIDWISDGNHDLSPNRGSAFTRASNFAAASDSVSNFAQNLD
jgi:predicted alpha/beta-hydrolase family hydrolase